MAKIIINGNHVFMRHWFTWYKLQGSRAHKIIFMKGKKAMKNKSTTVFNPNENGTINE